MGDRIAHFVIPMVFGLVAGWLTGRRRGYDEAVSDSEKLDVVTNKLQAMCFSELIACPKCKARSATPGPTT